MTQFPQLRLSALAIMGLCAASANAHAADWTDAFNGCYAKGGVGLLGHPRFCLKIVEQPGSARRAPGPESILVAYPNGDTTWGCMSYPALSPHLADDGLHIVSIKTYRGKYDLTATPDFREVHFDRDDFAEPHEAVREAYPKNSNPFEQCRSAREAQ